MTNLTCTVKTLRVDEKTVQGLNEDVKNWAFFHAKRFASAIQEVGVKRKLSWLRQKKLHPDGILDGAEIIANEMNKETVL